MSEIVKFQILAVLWFAVSSPTSAESVDRQVDFARDVRPLLSNACFACHGPDEENRQADLRLDSFASATADLGGYKAIEPGDVDASEVWLRVTSDDVDTQMPPPGSGKELTAKDRQVLKLWISQGAAYAEHWAFLAPVAPEIPSVPQLDSGELGRWNENPIDRLIAKQIYEKGLTPQNSADRATLLRRLSLDLIGLPPTPEQLNYFLGNQSPNAYQQEVDRLLASEHFGERWGRLWLDNARYADSDGFEKDKPRPVWFYRDWVTRALNADMPYDQFVIKQVAGDLLPNATQDDMVATGFLRNSMHNEEGGVDPKQFRMEAMYDRVDAIGKSVLGLTLQCAQCHSHKYDPISHTDYYRLFAMLNNCHEASMTVYTDDEQELLGVTLQQIDNLYQSLRQSEPGIESEFEAFVAKQLNVKEQSFEHLSINWIEETIGGQRYLPQSDGSYLQQGYAATKSSSKGDVSVNVDRIDSVRIEIMRDPNLPHGGPGRSYDGTWALSEFKLLAKGADGQFAPVKIASASASIDPPRKRLEPRYWFKEPDPERVTGPIGFAIDGDEKTAWTGTLSPGRRNDPQVAYLVLSEPIQSVDNQPIDLQVEWIVRHGGWNSDDNQSHNIGRFRIGVSAANDDFDTMPPKLRTALRDASTDDGALPELSNANMRALFENFLQQSIDPKAIDTLARAEKIWQQHPAGTGQLIVRERTEPRKTYRLHRGDFLSPKEQVSGGTPKFLHRLPDNVEGNRLDLAHWLVDRDSPTTARSIVNRIWQAYFGIGLSATTDDLGMQGEPPTHVELLDHLAIELMDHDWSLKSLHRSIVLSQTYRQSSQVDEHRLAVDPDNRWLSRGSRLRVPAEMVRDIALSVSGLLDDSVGGPPAYPPAPDFLFLPPDSYGPKVWGIADKSIVDPYRRGIYTFRFRSTPYPAYQAFDAPTGEVSCVRRSQSNTPLQALVTLNETLFVQCAASLADAVLAEPDSSDGGITLAAGIDRLFIRCLSRHPRPQESALLGDFFDQQLGRLSQEPSMAEKLVAHGSVQSDLAAVDRAAWIALARVVLNLDETITKQ